MNDRVDFTYEELHNVPLTDRERPFHDIVGCLWICDPELLRPVLDATFEGDLVYSADDFDCFMHEQYTDYHLFSSASNRLGLLKPGEIFGFFPSRQMGGEGYPEDMRKADIVEHLLFHLQLGPATLIEWQKDPNNPDNPLRRPFPVRLLGPQ